MITFLGWLWWWVSLSKAGRHRHHAQPSPTAIRPSSANSRRDDLVLCRAGIRKRATVHGTELAREGGVCLAGHLGAWDLCLIPAASAIPTHLRPSPNQPDCGLVD